MIKTKFDMPSSWEIKRKKHIFREEFCNYFAEKLRRFEDAATGKITVGRKCKYSITAINWTCKGLAFIPVAGPLISLAGDILTKKGIKRSIKITRQLKGRLVKIKLDAARARELVENAIEILIKELSYEVANIYEYQIVMLQYNTGNRKYLQRFAKAAVDRMISCAKKENFNRNFLLQGLIEVNPKNKSYSALRTIKNKDWKIPNIFICPGIRCETKNGYKFLRGNAYNASEYGYRGRIFTLDIKHNCYKSEDLKELAEDRETDFSYHRSYQPLTRVVDYTDLQKYAKQIETDKNTKKPKQFNEFIKEKYKLSQKITAVFRNTESDFEQYLKLDLRRGRFCGVDFMHFVAQGMNLREADFSKANLVRANLMDADLSNAKLFKTNLSCAIIDGTNFTETNLTQANMCCVIANRKTDFTNNVTLGRANLAGAEIAMAKTGITFLKELRKQRKKSKQQERRIRQLEDAIISSKYTALAVSNNIGKLIPIYYRQHNAIIAIKEKLTKSKIVTISGTPGYGKTQLAIYYINKKFHRKYPSAIIWRFQGTITDTKATERQLKKDYRQFVRALGINPDIYKEDFNGLKKAVAAQLEDRHFLLFFDDIRKPELISDYLPDKKLFSIGSGVIITTRDRNFYSQTEKNLPLEGFNVDEAVEFLIKNKEDTEANRKQAKILANKLSLIPLGLAAAKMYVNKNKISIEEYLRHLSNSEIRRDLEVEESKLLDGYYQKPEASRHLTYVLRLSYEQLNDDAQTILNIASFLAKDSIPIFLFNELMANPIKLNSGLNAIHTVSGLAWLHGGEDDQRLIFMHGITQEVIRNVLTEQQRSDCLLSVAWALSRHFSKDNRYPQAYWRNNLLMSHVEELLKHIKEFKVKQELDIYKIQLQHILGFHYSQIGMYAESEQWLRKVKLLCDRLAGLTSQEQTAATIYEQLSKESQQLPEELYQQLTTARIMPDHDKDVLAGKLLNEQLRARIKQSAEKRRSLSTEDYQELVKAGVALNQATVKKIYLPELYVSILYSLGRTYFYTRDTIKKDEFIKYLQLALNISEEISNQNKINGKGLKIFHLYTVQARALLYIELEGNEQKLIEAKNKYLEFIRNDHEYFENGILIKNENDLFSKTKDCQQLIRCYIRLLELTNDSKQCKQYVQEAKSHGQEMEQAIKQQIAQGHKPIRLADYYNTMADLLCHKRNPECSFQDTAKYYRQAKKEERGRNNYPLADAYYGLAYVYMKLGYYAKAKKYACRCIEIRKNLYTSDHRSIQGVQDLLTNIAKSRPPIFGGSEEELNIPEDIAIKIFRHVEVKDFSNVMRVNRSWCNLFKHPDLKMKLEKARQLLKPQEGDQGDSKDHKM